MPNLPILRETYVIGFINVNVLIAILSNIMGLSSFGKEEGLAVWAYQAPIVWEFCLCFLNTFFLLWINSFSGFLSPFQIFF